MRVFRRRHTLRLAALLAFAMQVVLAFAQTHTHSYGFAGSQALAQRAITYGMCRVDAAHRCPPPAPHDDHGQCSICGALSLAGSALLYAPPALPLVHAPMGAPPPVRAVALVRGVSTVHFQARAPPRV
jgi:hypothetical protein